MGESLIKAEGALLSSGKPAPSWTREGDFDVLYMFLRIFPVFSSLLYIFLSISFVFSSSLYKLLRIYFVFSSLLYTFFCIRKYFSFVFLHLRFSIFFLTQEVREGMLPRYIGLDCQCRLHDWRFLIYVYRSHQTLQLFLD